VNEDRVGKYLLGSREPTILISNENDAVAILLEAPLIGFLRSGIVVDEKSGRYSVGVQTPDLPVLLS
jgi:hypothetical protein